MPRFKLRIEYAGTRYSGWQVQKNARTVQGELHRAVIEATGVRDFELYGSGRTDAGVHALAQVAHLDVRTSLPPEGLRRRINDALPADINVLAVEKALHKFHARHDAISRAYVYQIARRRTAFAKPFVWWVKDPLDIGVMGQAAQAFVGRRDFHGFTDDDPEEKSTIVEIGTCRVEEDGDAILIVIEGSHFLWKLVRRLVGVLVEIGKGALPPTAPAALLKDPKGIPAALTAPPSGLFLARVSYPGDAVREIPRPPVALPRAFTSRDS
jgi:tRNA pseudouridine38-40 synthase